ncbi:uncharacterized protein LOC129779806 [Toxorhynchites rutilus septentrionalis]|uniref:uncharacterized protein LOC129779806 n=1 Tax=Toxorhynchites rutilus septentrionalis TaxID=329112 RepID=UPI0024792A53|nr:uncharacterized protein LOC129779806 [Toxorhynchites rutilus septentrionalis]
MPPRISEEPLCAVSASILGRKVCAPTENDWLAAKRVLRYLKSTKGAKLLYKNDTERLLGFSDANWAGNSSTRRSTTGYVFLYAGGAISWSSRHQHCITLSSRESEYVALREASQGVIWLRKLLSDMGETLDGPTCIMEDNQGWINPIENLWKIVKRSVYTERSKNEQQLWDRIQACWYAIPVPTCQKLVNSMPNRVRDVMRNKGYMTKY